MLNLSFYHYGANSNLDYSKDDIRTPMLMSLLIPGYRKLASYGIIILLIAVYPANIYLAFNEDPQLLINISSFAASWIRLPMQFLLIGIAYYHSR